ncbi:MAG: alpha/beta fold hydrolase [Chromatiales bacterium]|nr:alpha/beta fold hydrolase [Chromatiales bacterium]
MSPIPPETVVVVHGLWMNGAEAGLLRHRLSDEHGYPTVLFQYGTFEAGFNNNADRLRNALDQIESPRIHLVGHSTGGVMALVALQRRPLAKPGRVVCLGSPLRGSMVAEKLSQLGELGAAILGPTGREALVGRVLSDDVKPDRDVGSIAGTTSVGAGMMLGILPEPNDGTIAEVETKMPWLKDHLSYPVTHTGFLVSPEIALQTAFFLRHGMFNRQSPAYKSTRSEKVPDT